VDFLFWGGGGSYGALKKAERDFSDRFQVFFIRFSAWFFLLFNGDLIFFTFLISCIKNLTLNYFSATFHYENILKLERIH